MSMVVVIILLLVQIRQIVYGNLATYYFQESFCGENNNNLQEPIKIFAHYTANRCDN